MTVRVFPTWPPPTVRVDCTAYVVEPAPGGQISQMFQSFRSVEGGLSLAPDQKEKTLTLGPIGAERGTLEVWFPKQSGDPVMVRRGCFSGTLEDFAERCAKHPSPEHRAEYGRIVQALRLIAGEE